MPRLDPNNRIGYTLKSALRKEVFQDLSDSTLRNAKAAERLGMTSRTAGEYRHALITVGLVESKHKRCRNYVSDDRLIETVRKNGPRNFKELGQMTGITQGRLSIRMKKLEHDGKIIVCFFDLEKGWGSYGFYDYFLPGRLHYKEKFAISTDDRQQAVRLAAFYASQLRKDMAPGAARSFLNRMRYQSLPDDIIGRLRGEILRIQDDMNAKKMRSAVLYTEIPKRE